MSSAHQHFLRGSERHPIPGSCLIGAPGPDESLRVTLYLRRNPRHGAVRQRLAPHDCRSIGRTSSPCTSAIAEAAPNDMARVEDFAYEYGLNVLSTNRAARAAVLTGDAVAMRAAFGVSLCYYEIPREVYRSYHGPIYLPEELDGIVEAVFGLDDRRVSAPPLGYSDAPLPLRSALPESLERVPRRSSPWLAPHSFLFDAIQPAAGLVYPSGLPGDWHPGSIGVVLCGALENGELQTDVVRSAIQRVAPRGLSAFDEILLKFPAGMFDPERGGDVHDLSTAQESTHQPAGLCTSCASLAIYVAESTEQGWIDALTEAVTRPEPLRTLFVLDEGVSEGGPGSPWTVAATAMVNEAMTTAAARDTVVCRCHDSLSIA